MTGPPSVPEEAIGVAVRLVVSSVSKMCAKVSVVTLHALRGSRRRNQHVNPGQLGGFFANALEGRMLAKANLEERFVQPVGQAERSWVMTAYSELGLC